MSLSAENVEAPAALSRNLTVISLIVPVVPIVVFLSTLPKLKPLLADGDIALPIITQWMLAPWLVGGTILLYGVHAVVLTICSRVGEMRSSRGALAGLFLIGWLFVAGSSLVGVLLPYLRITGKI